MDIFHEACNIIITGVGGQGNVLSSQVLGQSLVDKGFLVTIGETYGASQRGGAVMSHIRMHMDRQRSPLIPRGKADIIVGLEPVESLRVVAKYGNAEVIGIVNTRPIYPVDVNIGNAVYPELKKIQTVLSGLTGRTYYLDATRRAVNLGSPILTNMVMMGALLALGLLPLSIEELGEELARRFANTRLSINMKAVEEGRKAIQYKTRNLRTDL